MEYWIERDVTRDADRKQHLLRMAALLPYDLDTEIRVLDVGAGYGAASEAVFETFPHAHVVLHDFSEPMLSHARKPSRILCRPDLQVMADLSDPSWVQAVGGPFDGVVSAIASTTCATPMSSPGSTLTYSPS